MRLGYYILNKDGKPVPAADVFAWARFFENSDQRIVKQEKIGDVVVSTVFLGIDRNFGGSGTPILWETMVFGGRLHHEMNRCSGNREQAEAMHTDMMERVAAVELLQCQS